MKNKSVKKSLEKSKNVLEEKRKNGQAKKLHKKDQHVYNNCYELLSRATSFKSSLFALNFVQRPNHSKTLRASFPAPKKDFSDTCSSRNKKTAPQYNSNFSNCKKTLHQYSLSSRKKDTAPIQSNSWIVKKN